MQKNEYKLKKGELAVDVSRQLTQSGNTYLGIQKYDDNCKCLIIRKKDKKELIKKTKGELTNHLEKIHCTSIFLGIYDMLDDVNRIILCKDLNTKGLIESMRKILQKNGYGHIKVICKSDNVAHKVANGCYKSRSKYPFIILGEREILESIKGYYL